MIRPKRIERGQHGRLWDLARLALGAALIGLWSPALGADATYPFEGTWVRADRVCSATSPIARTYSHRDVVSPSDRCTFRKVELGSGEWELDEECRRPDRRRITERIHMLGPDAILVRRQIVRLKIPRGRRFMRCTIAAPAAPASPMPKTAAPAAPKVPTLPSAQPH